MRKNIIGIFIFCAFAQILLGQGIVTLEDAMPKPVNENPKIVKHNSYILEYSEEHEQAYWVVYKVTPTELDTKIKRFSRFLIDTLIETGSANNKDYAKSGYDRGHLKPAYISKTSELDMRESFFYSNMSPQAPSFNRGRWKKLEKFVVDVAKEEGSLWVVTGPALENNLEKIGENGVSIPRFYYKVLYDLEPPEYKAIAILMKNEKSDKLLLHSIMSVDKLEEKLGMDFFPNLDDKIENKIEASSNFMIWKLPDKNGNRNNSILPENVIFK